jgi:hypothetical protein
MTVGK